MRACSLYLYMCSINTALSAQTHVCALPVCVSIKGHIHVSVVLQRGFLTELFVCKSWGLKICVSWLLAVFYN